MSAVADRVVIEALGADGARAVETELVALLQDAVDGGASVGFLPPLDADEAREYWHSVCAAVEAGTRVLLVACEPRGAIVGTAQLALETRPNGRHRAEVMKVMVLTDARRRGIGRALMLAVEEHARRLARTTLVLDTRQGDPSERLYTSVGWTFAGAIPEYARSVDVRRRRALGARGERIPDGGLDPSAFYYKLLDARRSPSATEGPNP